MENLGIEREHRTLVVTRKGYKLVTMPLARAPPGPDLAGSPPGRHRLA
jgi:hypothetical protein